jgi:hypothetical protein
MGIVARTKQIQNKRLVKIIKTNGNQVQRSK